MIILNVLYSPYIPPEKVDDFNVSLWAGVISGIVTGIFTGLLVGVLLWKFQRKDEERQTSLQCEKEYRLFLRKLKLKFYLSQTTTISTEGAKWLPKNKMEILALILNSPIDFWSDYLGNKSNFNKKISIIKQILDIHSKFIIISSKLDTLIEQRLRDTHYGLNLQEQIQAFYGILNDFDIEALKSYLRTLNIQRIQMHKEILLEESFKNITNDYKSTKNQLNLFIRELLIDLENL